MSPGIYPTLSNANTPFQGTALDQVPSRASHTGPRLILIPLGASVLMSMVQLGILSRRDVR